MKNQGNVSLPNSNHNNSTSEFKDNKLFKMSEGEFRSLMLKMIKDFKEDSNKQINENEVRKSI
jgi:hypothetical protein